MPTAFALATSMRVHVPAVLLIGHGVAAQSHHYSSYRDTTSSMLSMPAGHKMLQAYRMACTTAASVTYATHSLTAVYPTLVCYPRALETHVE